MRWKDLDEGTFHRELESLGAKLKSLESIVFHNPRANEVAEAFRLSLTKSDGNEVQQVVFVEKESLAEVGALASEIEKLITPKRAVGIAALSRAVWSTLKREHT
jgi:hypothetical protein